jgi:hypothetical protein
MKYVSKILFIAMLFFCQKSMALSVYCMDADWPWQYQTVAAWSASEGQTYDSLFIHTEIDSFHDGNSYHDEYTAELQYLENTGGAGRHRFALATGYVGIAWGHADFGPNSPHEECASAYYIG